ncbi:unnamed protein product, partial [Polarella glacialis]
MACWKGLCRFLRSRGIDDEPKTLVLSGSLRERLILSNSGRLHESYNLEGQKLGEGTFGSVRKASCRQTGLCRAVKTIVKTGISDVPALQREIELMKAMDHPNIVKLFESFEDHRSVYLVMELCDGGELFDRVIEAGHLTERQAAVVIKQACRALCYMHSQGVCHRDLKPENFLLLNKCPLEESTLKLIDFGLSRRFQPGEVLKTAVGTLAYVAPEVLKQAYSTPCDLWSLGVIMYVLLCGRVPFDGDDKEMVRKARKGNYCLEGPDWEPVSERAKILIRRLLLVDPSLRPSATQALEDKWIKELCEDVAGATLGPLGPHIVDNLRASSRASRFKKAALTVVVRQLDEAKLCALRGVFVAI